MPLPEGYLPRKGDVLVLHGRVKYDVVEKEDVDEDQKLTVWVRLEGDYQDRRIPLETVVSIFARKWELGERVIGNSLIGEVVGVYEDSIWVKFDTPMNAEPLFGTFLANDLEAAAPKALVIEPAPTASDYASEHERSVAFQEAGDAGATVEESDVKF